ncbi:MAG: PASTA domain-containing protein [Bacteroidales bacterium]|nr:PASTA domain-containing protein [Bacteroidales bacterium]MDD2424738.1 PASTA domain-containing protein [Bacteroidales bacterium]MDD3989305.1 PASTA domain-containing protein [Bacteroidales bacterium]MDD4639371.1 PASTA domain-containing protein [Bacteroidales bacterium]
MKKSSVRKNWFLRLLIKGAVVVVLLLIITHIFLSLITRHNRELAVPDFAGMTVTDAGVKAADESIRIEITDSIFIPGMQRGIVLRQNPAAGNMVKKNRRVLLTINTISPKMVNMPSVTGYSLRQAKAELAAKGLNIGYLFYVPDMATNNVLSQKFKGSHIPAGTPVESGSSIDLEVGNNGETNAFIPDLTGMPLNIARDILTDNSLNIGRIHYDNTIKTYSDSVSGFVYRQNPQPSAEAWYPLGTRIELYLRAQREKSPVMQKE